MRRRLSLFGSIGLALLALFVAPACQTKAQKYRENYERHAQVARPVVGSFLTALRAIRADLLTSPPEVETPCDRDAVSRAFGSARASLGPAFVDLLFVDLVLAPKPIPTMREDAFFLMPELNLVAPQEPVVFAQRLQDVRDYCGDALVVFISKQDLRPSLLGGDPTQWNGGEIPENAFTAGKLQAWAVAYDVGRKLRLCQRRVQATSSARVAVASRPPAQALFEDYAARAKAAASDALGRAEPRLRVHF